MSDGSLPSGRPRPPFITERERQVLVLLCQGFINKEIGDRLGISERTVEAHRYRLYHKLEVKRRGTVAVLVTEAIRLRIFDPGML